MGVHESPGEMKAGYEPPSMSINDPPHSRACGIRPHNHGVMCDWSCPSCRGGRLASYPKPCPYCEAIVDSRDSVADTERELRDHINLRHPDKVLGQSFHNETTLFKVHRALLKSGLGDEQALNAITQILNEGILFRERIDPSGPVLASGHIK